MTPQELLAQAGKAYPGIWRRVDEFRAERGTELPDWPQYVFLPVAGWYAITCELLGLDRLGEESIGVMQGLACLGTWRPTQDIVRFDMGVYTSLANTGLDGELPTEILKRLPAWCVYVETPGLVHANLPQDGFFAYLEKDANTGHEELRIFFNGPMHPFYPVILHLGPWDINRACQKANAFALAAGGEKVHNHRPIVVDAGLTTALNLLLYLCAYGLEDQEGWGASGRISYPPQVRTKTGWRLFPPSQPNIHTVGTVYGEQIRRARLAGGASGPRSGPRPHVRRAHWHGYWLGPRKATEGDMPERRFDLRWLPPIPVAMSDDTAPDD